MFEVVSQHEQYLLALQWNWKRWNKVNTLIISWQAFADLHAKATSSGLREMLD